jgi:hypothetical protein
MYASDGKQRVQKEAPVVGAASASDRYAACGRGIAQASYLLYTTVAPLKK